MKQKDVEAIAKLEKKRSWTVAKNTFLMQHVENFPEHTHFLSQLKHYYKRYDAWEEYAKEHTPIVKYNKEEYLKEFGLITETNKQYRQCNDMLAKELRADILGFRSDLKTWQKSIEKQLKELSK